MLLRSKLRLAVTILGGLVVLGLCALLLLHTPPVRRYALQQATELLRDQGIDFGSADLDYNLLELSMAVRDVVIRSPEAPDLPAFARIWRLSHRERKPSRTRPFTSSLTSRVATTFLARRVRTQVSGRNSLSRTCARPAAL